MNVITRKPSSIHTYFLTIAKRRDTDNCAYGKSAATVSRHTDTNLTLLKLWTEYGVPTYYEYGIIKARIQPFVFVAKK